MKPARPLPRLLPCLPLVLLLVGGAAAHAATGADLLGCRAIADAGARLACYDALVVAPGPAAAAPAAAAPAATPAATFGFEDRAAIEGPKAIESRIEGRFQGWGPRSQIRLANGQVWQVIDDSRAVMDLTDPRVTVSRGTFSTFFLQIEGRNQAPRVKRVE